MPSTDPMNSQTVPDTAATATFANNARDRPHPTAGTDNQRLREALAEPAGSLPAIAAPLVAAPSPGQDRGAGPPVPYRFSKPFTGNLGRCTMSPPSPCWAPVKPAAWTSRWTSFRDGSSTVPEGEKPAAAHHKAHGLAAAGSNVRSIESALNAAGYLTVSTTGTWSTSTVTSAGIGHCPCEAYRWRCLVSHPSPMPQAAADPRHRQALA